MYGLQTIDSINNNPALLTESETQLAIISSEATFESNSDLAKLRLAFNYVNSQRYTDNWKDPIVVSLDKNDLRRQGINRGLIKEAIRYFTGSSAQIREYGQHIVVTARGYYLTVGA